MLLFPFPRSPSVSKQVPIWSQIGGDQIGTGPGPDGTAPPLRQTLVMASLPDSQLSALASNIEDLSGRVTQLAEELTGAHASESAGILYEVERTLAAIFAAVLQMQCARATGRYRDALVAYVKSL